jgi:S-formylglutathione hydrolase FrmB
MMKKFAALLIISLLAFGGCSTPDNPLEPVYPSGSLTRAFVNSSSLDINFVGEPAGRPVYIYEPFGYTTGEVDSYEVFIDSIQEGGWHYDTTYVNYVVTSAEYPTLYLLHGYGGTNDYYQRLFLVQDILDEMIADGEIMPMLVITPDCNTEFGGSFYTNSALITTITAAGDTVIISFDGRFEDFMVNDLIDYVNTQFNADTLSSMRAIGGHSMGGYGAMKLAMKHPDIYGSASSMSAPLTFGYLQGLLPAVYAENGLVPGQSDTAGFYSISPGLTRPVTSMMFAMGAAFTPHEHLNPDTTYFHRLADLPLFVGIDLPFNIAGELVDTSAVWNAWLQNDPTTMLATNNYNSAFDNLPIYLDAGDDDDLGFQLQAQAFHEVLANKGINHTFVVYSGYDGYPASHSGFIADRLRTIFKFHSDAFQQAQQ